MKTALLKLLVRLKSNQHKGIKEDEDSIASIS